MIKPNTPIFRVEKKTHPVVRVVLSSVLVLVFLFAGFHALFPLQAVRVFGFKIYLVSSTGSMQPLLSYNDMIVVKKYDFNSVQEGDIITFIAEVNGQKIYITHEVVDVITHETTGQRLYRTQGLNSSKPDGNPVSEFGDSGTFQYVGKYWFKVPVIGTVVGFLGTPFGFMCLLTNSLGLLCIYVILEYSPKKED